MKRWRWRKGREREEKNKKVEEAGETIIIISDER